MKEIRKRIAEKLLENLHDKAISKIQEDAKSFCDDKGEIKLNRRRVASKY